LGLVLAAGRSDAFPIVFNGPGGYGISAASAAGAEADGVRIIEVDSISTAASLNLTIPAPDVLSFQLVGSPSVSNPNRATSEWSVTNSGNGGLSDTWLVFLNPVTYTASEVGFEIDGDAGWALISIFVPVGAGGTTYFYPARFLGDLGADDTFDFLMHHLVGQTLTQQGNVRILPQYSVGALVGIPVPEPAQLVLVAIGLAVTATLRRRSA
jgi:hypothetical protein